MLTQPGELNVASEIAAILADQAALNARAFRVLSKAFGLSPALERIVSDAGAVLAPAGPPAEPPTKWEKAVADGIVSAGFDPERVAAAHAAPELQAPSSTAAAPARVDAAASAALEGEREAPRAPASPLPAPPSAAADPARKIETPRERRERVLTSYAEAPAPVADLSARLGIATPVLSAILSTARQAREERVMAGDWKRRDAIGGRRIKGAEPAVIHPSSTSQRGQIYREWAGTLETMAAIARRLGFSTNVVSTRLAEGRKANAPQVLEGDARRGNMPAPAQAKPEPVPAPPPVVKAEPVPAPPAPAPAARESVQPPAPAPRPILPKTAGAKPPPEPLPEPTNPVQIRARAQLRSRVLAEYEDTGDHARRLAARLDCTLKEVEWFLHDARQAGSSQVRLGDVRRARQERAGK